MADSILEQFGSFFSPGNMNDPRVNSALRTQIALRMMGQGAKKGYPKTLGEGLTAIGDALGDIGMARQLANADLATQARRPPEAAAATPGYAPADDTVVAPAVGAINSALTPPVQVASAPPAAEKIYENDEPSPLDPPSGADRVKMAATILGEENTPAGQIGVANVIRNRAVDGGYGGTSPGAVVTARNQFEPWNTEGGRARMAAALADPKQATAADNAIKIAYGEGGAAPQDPTAGKTMFYSPDAQRALGRPPPSWAKGEGQTLGGTSFYEGRQQGVNPRDKLAAALLAQRSGVPQPNPMPPEAMTPPSSTSALPPGGADQRLALNAPPGSAGIQMAPPVPQTLIRPPTQVAQAPQAIPPAGYIRPAPARPVAPDPSMTPREAQLLQWKAAEEARGNVYAAPQVINELATLQAKRAAAQARYAEDLKEYEAQLPLYQGDLKDAAERAQKYQKEDIAITEAKDKAALQARLGGREPEKFFTEFDKEREGATKTINALHQYAGVRDLLDKGVIVGTGQGLKVHATKLATALGLTGTEAVSRTEQMQAMLNSTVGIAIDTIQGSGQKVSDADLAIAKGTIGADPALQLATIKRLTSRAEQIARGKLNEYEDQRDYYLGGTRAERRYQLPSVPETAPAPHVRDLMKFKDNDEARAEFDRRFGPGAAELEIARAKRRARRGE